MARQRPYGGLATYRRLLGAQVRSQASYRATFAIDVASSALAPLIDIVTIVDLDSFLDTPVRQLARAADAGRAHRRAAARPGGAVPGRADDRSRRQLGDAPPSRAVLFMQLRQRPVVYHAAVVDHDQPPAEALDVREIVRGEHDISVHEPAIEDVIARLYLTGATSSGGAGSTGRNAPDATLSAPS